MRENDRDLCGPCAADSNHNESHEGYCPYVVLPGYGKPDPDESVLLPWPANKTLAVSMAMDERRRMNYLMYSHDNPTSDHAACDHADGDHGQAVAVFEATGGAYCRPCVTEINEVYASHAWPTVWLPVGDDARLTLHDAGRRATLTVIGLRRAVPIPYAVSVDGPPVTAAEITVWRTSPRQPDTMITYSGLSDSLLWTHAGSRLVDHKDWGARLPVTPGSGHAVHPALDGWLDRIWRGSATGVFEPAKAAA